MVWYEDKLRESIKNGEERLKNAKNFIEYNEIMSNINALKRYLYSQQLISIFSKGKFSDTMIKAYDIYDNNFLEVSDILNFDSVINEIMINNNWFVLPSITTKFDYNYSIDDILTLTCDFYKQFDPEYFKFFYSNFKNRNECFKVKNIDSSGLCYFDGIDKKSYITIKPDDKSIMTLSTIHEFAHATANIMNPKRAVQASLYTTREVEAYALELIAMDYFKKITNTNIYDDIKYNDLAFEMDRAQIFSNQVLMSLLWLDNGMKSKSSTLKEYSLDTGINIKLLKKLLTEDISEYIYDIEGYLYSIELYYLYLKDKEKFMDYYKKFISLGINEEHYNELRKMIGPITHSEEYFYNCLNDLKGSYGEDYVKEYCYKK